jgi:hypothetical protein
MSVGNLFHLRLMSSVRHTGTAKNRRNRLTDQEWGQFNRDKWYELPEDIRTGAVSELKRTLGEDNLAWFREQMNTHGTLWWVQDVWHFRGGMAIRNHLRELGYLDDQLPSNNWDDYYIPVVEAAALDLPLCLTEDVPEEPVKAYDDWDQW